MGTEELAHPRSIYEPRGSTPHHIIFLADPQLVDPHTYPGRPWPLSALTIKHTDLYLRRSYSALQKLLHPDTIFFLGDLFDGGREWATAKSESPEKRYKRYKGDFWLDEYRRFGRIFFDHWGDGGMAAGEGRGRKLFASLPGNHDLGLGSGIQLPVRDRFEAYFGNGNRIDIVGNHTFVSVDTVSLSALEQADPATGSQGQGLGDTITAGSEIWEPVETFLGSTKAAKKKAVARELRFQNGEVDGFQYDHVITDYKKTPKRTSGDRGKDEAEFPTILLTHVPLFRNPGTPCGPLREHWPPSAPPMGLENDERNAISVRAGYQYQNVLTPGISKQLVDKIGNVDHVFSGDDHDYCEVIHRGYTSSSQYSVGGIREITVKSMSWAMGVRKPGFLMLSLWNPVDRAGNPKGTDSAGYTGIGTGSVNYTMETHLCLLPDQLRIFIRYLVLLIITLSVLLVRSVVVVRYGLGNPTSLNEPNEPLLPITKDRSSFPSSAEQEKARGRYRNHPDRRAATQKPFHESHGSNSSISSDHQGLSVRSSTARTRSVSPGIGYGVPLASIGQNGSWLNGATRVETDCVSDGEEVDDWGMPGGGESTLRHGNRLPSRLDFTSVLREAGWSIWRVAWVVLLWYSWLIW
ncbi:MAG: hypothetical protein M1827_004717 [Pycnora praestabilis]|nr:MAG: hypothetical protein M1827_004717 [Pycnora praestabilis]